MHFLNSKITDTPRGRGRGCWNAAAWLSLQIHSNFYRTGHGSVGSP